MIPPDSTATIREALTHQPFLCDLVLLYEVEKGSPVACDEESNSFFSIYQDQVLQAANRSSGSWYGNFIAAGAGHIAGGKYYASCLIGQLLVIVAKALKQDANSKQVPPPIDSYFLRAVSDRVSMILGVSCVVKPEEYMSQVTADGERVLSELDNLERCEDLWRSEYGEDQWLAVKKGSVVGHNRDRLILEKYVQEHDVKPPVLYVPPRGKEIRADILTLIDLSKKKHL
jgi:hypothetical protein